MTAQRCSWNTYSRAVASPGTLIAAVALLLGQLLLAAHAFDHLAPAQIEESVCEICLLGAGADHLLDRPSATPTIELMPISLASYATVEEVSDFRRYCFARAPPQRVIPDPPGKP